MGENQMLRQLLPLLHTTCTGSSEIAKGVLGWLEEQRGHFWPHLPEGRKLWKKGWKALPRLATELGADNAEGLCSAPPTRSRGCSRWLHSTPRCCALL